MDGKRERYQSLPACQTAGLCSGRQASTDFGFKKLFGEECSKELLIDFLKPSFRKQRKYRRPYLSQP